MPEVNPSLAAVLQARIRRERLRPYQVAGAAGISRHHLWLIANGRIARPTPQTLRKLAAALATDPHDGAVDPAVRTEALRELSEAAGYPDLNVEPEPGALVREIRAVTGSQQTAAFYDELIRRFPQPSPTLQALLRALAEIHGRPGGRDVLGMLLEPALVALALGPEDRTALAEQLERLRDASVGVVVFDP